MQDGVDADAVDPHARIDGFEGLRVDDPAIMPEREWQPEPPLMTIAEQTAHLTLGST
jgi:hypothetical protein